MGHIKMFWIESQSTILRCSRTHFYVRTSENSQTLALYIILRCLRTHYFIQTFEKSYCLSTEHLFKICNDPFIHMNVWEWWEISFIESFWNIQYPIFSFGHLKMVNVFYLITPFWDVRRAFICPDICIWSDFNLKALYWDVLGLIFSSRHLKMARF